MPTASGIVIATGSEPAGRRSLLEIMDELSRPVNVGDETVRALAADAFRAAIRRVNRMGLWPWEVMAQDINLTANQAYASVGVAIKKQLSMHYLNTAGGTENEPLAYCSYDKFLEKWMLDVSGRAHSYTLPNLFEDGRIRFYPIPSADAVVRFAFYRVTPAPRSEDESIEMPDYAIEFAMSLAWEEFLKRLPPKTRPYDMALAREQSKEAMREMSAHVASPGDRSREIQVFRG